MYIKKIKRVLAITLILPLLLTSCTKSESGTLLGGATGALIGSRFGGGSGQMVGTALGAVGGALIGNKIGSYMDEEDQRKAHLTASRALETAKSGTTSTWRNPDNGHYGTVTPKKAYTDNKGKQCREYIQTVTIGGKTEQAYGTACRQNDGSWKIAS